MSDGTQPVMAVTRYPARVRVTATWEVDTDLEDSENRRGWLADPVGLLDGLTIDDACKVEIERCDHRPAPRDARGGSDG